METINTNNDEYYKALISLIIHDETISWMRFYNFLVSSTIMILAWSAIFAAQIGKQGSDYICIVLSIISVFGFITGICFASLGQRSRKYLELNFDQAIMIEKGMNNSDNKTNTVNNEISIKPFTESDKLRKGYNYLKDSKTIIHGNNSCLREFWIKIGSSRNIIVIGSFAYSMLFLILLLVSILYKYKVC